MPKNLKLCQSPFQSDKNECIYLNGKVSVPKYAHRQTVMHDMDAL